MILATIQPSFLPWLGYLEQVDVADVFVYLDDVRYTAQDWRNRNRFLDRAGVVQYLTVPVKAGSERLLINEVRIAEDPTWIRKLCNRLRAWYAGAPAGPRSVDAVVEVLNRRHDRLVDLNYDLMDILFHGFGITTPTFLSSDAAIAATDKNQRLIDLCLQHGADVLY
ncbi:WbqC family protein, partial [Nostoc sp. NIES-2111]